MVRYVLFDGTLKVIAKCWLCSSAKSNLEEEVIVGQISPFLCFSVGFILIYSWLTIIIVVFKLN